MHRIQKKIPTFPNPACERCVYIELLDKVVQPYMQPSVVRLPLLPGMPPTSVWVMPASAVPPAFHLELSLLLLGVAALPQQLPQLPRAAPHNTPRHSCSSSGPLTCPSRGLAGPRQGSKLGAKLVATKKCFYKCVFR